MRVTGETVQGKQVNNFFRASTIKMTDAFEYSISKDRLINLAKDDIKHLFTDLILCFVHFKFPKIPKIPQVVYFGSHQSNGCLIQH